MKDKKKINYSNYEYTDNSQKKMGITDTEGEVFGGNPP